MHVLCSRIRGAEKRRNQVSNFELICPTGVNFIPITLWEGNSHDHITIWEQSSGGLGRTVREQPDHWSQNENPN